MTAAPVFLPFGAYTVSVGRETLSTSPGSGIVSLLAGGPNCASGAVPGHMATCVCPRAGCQPPVWANKLPHPKTKHRAKIEGLITTHRTLASGPAGITHMSCHEVRK